MDGLYIAKEISEHILSQFTILTLAPARAKPPVEQISRRSKVNKTKFTSYN